MALTTLKVKNAKPGRHVDGRGLCLLVKDSGARTWVLRMQRNGRRRDYGLGSALEVSLAEAREAAAALRQDITEAQRLRIRQIPMVFINGRRLPRWNLEGHDVLGAVLELAGNE